MVKRRVCIFTGSRAEFGILFPLISALKAERSFDARILVSGTHTSRQFGLTYREILKDGISIDEMVKIPYKGGSPLGVADALGRGVIKYTAVLEKWKPQLIILMGDRYETFAAAVSAMLLRIPIAHLHGGEATYGLIDEAMRHSITKMAHLHFTSTEAYRKRVIQMGESPDRAFHVGALGIDNAIRTKPFSRQEIEKRIGMEWNKRNLLITLHPVTLEPGSSKGYVQDLLKALDELKDTLLIFTGSNADMEGAVINRIIKAYVHRNRHKAVFFMSMGQELFMGAMQHVDAVVGNSSSGIIEAPSFKIGTINVGTRQVGRIQASSVINCQPEASAVRKALEKLYSAGFRKKLRRVVNPYGQGKAALRIVRILKSQHFPLDLDKKFYQLQTRII